MPLYKAAKEIDAKYYPDVVEAGNLQTAISQRLAGIGSQLVATSTTEDFIPYARVEIKARSSQIYIAEEQRLFLFDFWSEGVLFGNGSNDDILNVAQAIHFWVFEQPSIEKMINRFDFFSSTEQGKAYEDGTITELQWQRLLTSWSSESHRLSNPEFSPLPLIVEAMKHSELRQLYPYTSLTRLRFSRTTGFPFTTDCPFAEPIGDNQFRVYSPAAHAVIGEGTVEEAIEMIIRHLPENYGAAINGTAEDL